MMLKTKIILVTLVLSGLFFCQRENLLQPDTGFQEMKNPREVIFNLQKAYNERNLEQYLACLAADFQCLSENSQWNKNDEQLIHQHMFQDLKKVKKINLTLIEVGSSTIQAAKLTYHYKLHLHYDDGFSDEAEGQVLFHFKEIMNHRWQISHWEERHYLNKTNSQNSTDYFPLQIGNWWYFQSDPLGLEPDERHKIIDTTTIKNKLYYIREVMPIIPDSQRYKRTDYFQQDSFGQVWHKSPQSTEEQIIFKFNTTIGDTWSYNDISGDTLFITLLSSGPAFTQIGNFNDVKSVLFDTRGTAGLVYAFAPNFGIIYIGGEGVAMVIKEANINNIHYPLIDAIAKTSWIQIKKYFKNNNNLWRLY